MCELSIRPVGAEAFRTAIDWAAREGWNPGLDDLPVFHAADPSGFLMGFSGDEPVSAISVVRYGAAFGFLGFYIVAEGLRGQGHGMATWDAGMSFLGKRTIGLDGVVAQQENYAKSGFVLAGRNIRHAGRPPLNEGAEAARGIRRLRPEDVEAVVAYDAQFFAGPRRSFTRDWIFPGNDVRRVALMAEADGDVAGYGVVRSCRSGYKIGPLFADDETTANALFTALTAVAGGCDVFLDTPEDNPAAVALARRHGLEPVFETARMYRGPAPDLPASRTYGITTFELG